MFPKSIRQDAARRFRELCAAHPGIGEWKLAQRVADQVGCSWRSVQLWALEFAPLESLSTRLQTGPKPAPNCVSTPQLTG